MTFKHCVLAIRVCRGIQRVWRRKALWETSSDENALVLNRAHTKVSHFQASRYGMMKEGNNGVAFHGLYAKHCPGE